MEFGHCFGICITIVQRGGKIGRAKHNKNCSLLYLFSGNNICLGIQGGGSPFQLPVKMGVQATGDQPTAGKPAMRFCLWSRISPWPKLPKVNGVGTI